MAQAEKMAKLTNLLPTTSWDAAWMARRRMLELIGYGVLAASYALFFLYQLISHWNSGEWWTYLEVGCGGVVFPFCFFLGFVGLRWNWSERQKMRAAEEGNDELAPLAVDQPSPLSLEGLEAGPERFALSGSWKDSIVADERGLRWWQYGWNYLRPAFLEWKAAKSFFVNAYAGEQKIPGCKVYVLDGHDCLYLWQLYDGIPDEKRAMFERFNRVVVSRSGLLLRDLSAAAAQVTRIAEQPGEG